MSKAWNHNVRKLTDEEIQKQIDDGKHWYQWRLKNMPERSEPEERLIFLERKCRISKKCQNESTHLLTYHYVTGRAGRVSYAEKPICEQHAQKYLTETNEH